MRHSASQSAVIVNELESSASPLLASPHAGRANRCTIIGGFRDRPLLYIWPAIADHEAERTPALRREPSLLFPDLDRSQSRTSAEPVNRLALPRDRTERIPQP